MVIAAKKAGVKRFVYASSSSVYGDNEEYREVEKERVIIWNPDYRVGFQYISIDDTENLKFHKSSPTIRLYCIKSNTNFDKNKKNLLLYCVIG